MIETQLFVYYRIPKPDIETGLRCATALMADLLGQNLAQGQLYQRDETDKPYFTIMEVITPRQGKAINTAELLARLDRLAIEHFSSLAQRPQRHVEVFNPVRVV